LPPPSVFVSIDARGNIHSMTNPGEKIKIKKRESKHVRARERETERGEEVMAEAY